jgi:hypothetical protein
VQLQIDLDQNSFGMFCPVAIQRLPHLKSVMSVLLLVME